LTIKGARNNEIELHGLNSLVTTMSSESTQIVISKILLYHKVLELDFIFRSDIENNGQFCEVAIDNHVCKLGLIPFRCIF
jgi:hypothetical protein